MEDARKTAERDLAMLKVALASPMPSIKEGDFVKILNLGIGELDKRLKLLIPVVGQNFQFNNHLSNGEKEYVAHSRVIIRYEGTDVTCYQIGYVHFSEPQPVTPTSRFYKKGFVKKILGKDEKKSFITYAGFFPPVCYPPIWKIITEDSRRSKSLDAFFQYSLDNNIFCGSFCSDIVHHNPGDFARNYSRELIKSPDQEPSGRIAITGLARILQILDERLWHAGEGVTDASVELRTLLGEK